MQMHRNKRFVMVHNDVTTGRRVVAIEQRHEHKPDFFFQSLVFRTTGAENQALKKEN